MKSVQQLFKSCFFLPVLIICLTQVVCAQSYSFTHYQVENGLSNNAVLCSIQDRHGFMWFGTKDGLNRFDGYTFKVFRNNPATPGTIGNNIIYCLYQDQSGVLWIGTDRGIYRYNDLTESFTFLKGSVENEIRDIKADNKGNIWFIAGISLYKYHTANQKITRYDRPLLNAVSLTIANGTLWVSTTATVIERYNEAEDSFTPYNVFEHSKPATAYWIQKVFYAGNGQLMVGTSNQGFKVFNTNTNTYKDVIALNPDKTEIFVRDFIKKSADEYWVATESGVYIYNAKNGKTELLHKQYNNPYSLTDNAVYTFCKDREGGIWAGTYFGGLNYFARQYTYFEKYFPKVGENSLSGNAVREICTDKSGTLWIGTEDAGLNKFDPKTGNFINYKPLGKSTDISTNNIHGLLTYNNLLLIGTFEHGLDVMKIATGKVINHYTVLNDTTLKSNFFYTLIKTRAGDVITATSRGLYFFNPLKHQFKTITEAPTDLFYTSVFEDNTGTIWAGTYRFGLYYFNLKTKQKGYFVYDPKQRNSISNNKINMIFQDSNNNLWVATENGLCRFYNKTKTFIRYTDQNGLPSNVIYALREDSRKNLWITTSKGLVCMNHSASAIKVFTKANGLLSDQFNYNSAYRDSAGNMYFGCVKGMIKFNPDNFTNNNYQPPVFITGLQVNNRDLEIGRNESPLKRSVAFTDTITLPYNQSSFSIDFAALSYTSPQTTNYAYQLTGLDKEWTYLHANRKVYFTRLAAGTYVFNVKSSADNSLWSKHQAKLTIIILPPFWESTNAYFTYIILLIIALYLVLRSYHQKTQQKNKRKMELFENEKEREIYHSKIAFFTHVAHEIRTPLTLIVGPMEKVMSKAALVPEVKKNLSIMERNTRRLLALTNQLLDFSKTETHGFTLTYVKTDIVVLVKECIMRYRDAAQQKRILVKFEYESAHFLAYVDSEAVNKIISNLLDNAIKYAAAKVYIQLYINTTSNTFTIYTKSDGNIIPGHMKEKIFETFFRMKEAEQQSGTGIGLPLSRYLAELHKGALILEPPVENLNVFALTLPIHQEIEFNI